MTLRRATAAASLIVLLVLLGVPTVDGCPSCGDAPHRCCAGHAPKSAPEPSGCCGDAEAGETQRHPTVSDPGAAGCDCFHAPAAPAAVAVGAPAPSIDGLAPGPPSHEVAVAEPVAGPLARCTDHVPRAARSPLFIMACAFLI